MDTKTFPLTHADLNRGISPVLVSVLQPTLLLFLLWFTLTYMQLFQHEGGHALVHLIYGARVPLFYAHPFSFVGYIRPGFDYYNVRVHISGTIVEISRFPNHFYPVMETWFLLHAPLPDDISLDRSLRWDWWDCG